MLNDAEAQPYAEIYDENGRLLKEVQGTTVSMIKSLVESGQFVNFLRQDEKPGFNQ